MQLRALDLNLLVTLDAVLWERSVSRAAERLGLSQPAVSTQLARLRRHFGDPLLTRVGNAYQLTPLAHMLKGRTRTAIASVERVFAAEPDFDPSTTAREFTIMTSDYVAELIGASLTSLLAEHAPNARVCWQANTSLHIGDPAHDQLANTDLLVMPHGLFVDDIPYRDLFVDEWVCLVAHDNQAVKSKLSMRDLADLPWAVNFNGPLIYSPALRQLRTLGIEPRVQVTTESFLTIGALVAGSDRIALLPRRLCERIPPTLDVRWLPCPFEVAPIVETMWWHPLHHDDPEHRFLRDIMLTAAGDTGVTNGPASTP